MTLQEFDTALKGWSADIYELAAPKGLMEYAVWHKYGTQSSFADDRNAVGLPKVQIDIFSQQRDNIFAENICTALEALSLPFSIVSEEYDPEYSAYRTILQLVVI